MTSGPLEVVIFGRGGCHLCDLVESEIRRTKGVGSSLTVIGIDSDPELQTRYWARIPVVTVGGKEVFEAKMMDPEGEWRKRLPALLKES